MSDETTPGLTATVLGSLVEWAGESADLDDCREAAAVVSRNLSAAGFGPVRAVEADVIRETFALGAAWALGDDEEAPAALKARAESAEAALARVKTLRDAYYAWDGDPASEFASSPRQRAQLDAALNAALDREEER